MSSNYFNRIKHVADTFEGLVEELKGFTREKLGTEYEDFGNDDTATLLMEWIAYVGASVSWSSDRKLADNIMEFTRSLSIATAMAESEGLKLRGRSPQMTEITIQSESANSISIEKNSIAKTSVGDFLIPVDYTVPPGVTIKILAYEMSLVEFTINSTGEVFQTFELSDMALDDIDSSIVSNRTSIINRVDEDGSDYEEIWKEIDFLPHINKNITDSNENRYFTINYIDNKLSFGDGITGERLPKGTLDISLYTTRGLTKEIPQIKNNSISKILNPVTEEEYPITIISNSQGVGASNGDLDLEHVKYLYKGFKRARNVAINKEDFEFFAMNCDCSAGKVAKANAYIWQTTEENADILKVERDMYSIFNTFIESLQALYESFKGIIKEVNAEVIELKTFMAYIKEMVNSFDLTFGSLKTSYTSTLESSKSALLSCKSRYGEKIPEDVEPPTFYYDFSNERSIMDTAFSEFNILLKTFGNLKSIEGKGLDDYIISMNRFSDRFSVDLGEFLEENYKQSFQVLFSRLNDQIQKILYSPETSNIISLVVLTEDEDGYYRQANRYLIKELYLNLNRVSAPNIVLNIQDGYSNILNGRVKLKVKLKEVDSGYSQQIVKEKVQSFLSKKYKRLEFGEGISVYDVASSIESNISGVDRAGVEILEIVPNGEEHILNIDEYGDLDMSNHSDKLLQAIVIEVV